MRLIGSDSIKLLAALVLTFSASVTLGVRDAQAVAPELLCTAPNVTPGSQCTSFIWTDWSYTGITGFGIPNLSGYDSMSALSTAVQSKVMENIWVCSFTQTGMIFDIGDTPYWGIPPILYDHGVDYLHQNRITFDRVTSDQYHPCGAPAPVTIYVGQDRVVGCPNGFTTVYEAGPPVIGPYCARPWNTVDEQKCSECEKKGIKPFGNPIDSTTGNKIQVETDYRGAGASPLSFQRHYNSLFSRINGPDGFAPKYIAGVAWYADYFQKIAYNSTGGVSTAFAYRPDTQRIIFNESGGAFTGPADVIGVRLTAQRDGLGNITGWTLKLASDTVETYGANGKLLTITSRSGVAQTLAYDTAGQLASVTDSFGHQLLFSFSNGRIATITQPDGQLIQYTYDANKNLTQVTDAMGRVRQYHYERGGSYLTGITDENAQRHSTYTYNDYTNLAVSTELAGGVNKYTIAYPGDISRTVTDPQGNVQSLSLAVNWGVRRFTSSASTSKCAGCSNSKSATYDANANLASQRDFNGGLTCYAYDLARNLETVRVEGFASAVASCPASLATYTPTAGTLERKIVTAWHATFRVPTSITEANRTTSFTHDPNGNVLSRTVTDTSVTPNVSRTWNYTYNAFGRVLTEDGPRTDATDITTYTYYTCTTGFQCGQLNTITNALGHVTTYNSYNAHGQPTQITDANGLATSLTYDARQRLTDRCTGATLPGCSGGELTHLDYWPTGLLNRVTNPDASYIEYTYDNAHRLTQINDGALNKVVYTLDNAGNRTAENTYDPSLNLRRTHTRVFNTLNQLWKDINAAGTANVTTVFGYDNDGNQTTVNAPLARNSTSFYDELSRLKQITDPNSGNTLFGYDANDNLISVTDPRTLSTTYTYTGFGDLKTQTSPDTGLTTNTYDSGGNLKTSTDARSAITTYTYDAMNRVGTAAYKIGSTTDQTITYTYDAGTNGKGHLTGASDANHSMSWTYDAQGRVIGKGQLVSGLTVAQSIGYGYNSAGKLASIVLPSGKTIAYGYNANGQVTSVTLNGSPNVTILNNVTYDPFGPITGWTWGNGTASASRTFDTDGKLTAISSTAASVGNRTFGYDDAFRITAANDVLTPANSWTLGYDLLDRLNSATKTGTTIGYTYDADGNRLTQTGTSASTYTVPGASNKLSSVTGALSRTYGYDAMGNVQSSGATTHTYFNSGRMKTGKLGAASATTYIYNALGQRVKKSGGAATTTVFMYDEAGHLVGEYTISAGVAVRVQETVWLGDIPVATLRTNGANVDVFYVHTDQLNTPRKVTSNAATPVLRWKWDPTPFGEGTPTEPAGAFKYNLRFLGQYFDLETNLNYNYFRDYDPAIGRYAESDPIGLRGGLNTYLYANAQPNLTTDPRGRNPATGALWGGNIGTAIGSIFGPAGAGAGRLIGAGIGAGLGYLAVQCMEESEESRCRKAKEKCHIHCVSIFVDDPGSLIGNGSDWFGRLRNCVRECLDDNNCHNF
jgi:RHS repeat-associated protein